MAQRSRISSENLHLLLLTLLLSAALFGVNALVDNAHGDTNSGVPLYFLTGVSVFWSLPLFAWSQRHRLRAALAGLASVAESDADPLPANRLLNLHHQPHGPGRPRPLRGLAAGSGDGTTERRSSHHPGLRNRMSRNHAFRNRADQQP
jgi:hypothetical protein